MTSRRTISRAAISMILAATVTASGSVAAQDDPAPPTVPTDDIADQPPVEPLEPAQPGDEIVHSWALTPSQADGSGGSRTQLSYVSDPGQIIRDAVTLFNYGNVPLTFRIYATDAYNNASGDFALLEPGQEPTDIGAWVTPLEEFVTLAPGTQATVPVTIVVPAQAAPGDHVGAIVAASEAQSTGPTGELVTVERRTGSRIYTRVNGPLTADLAVEQLDIDYDGGVNPATGTASVTFSLHNRGNVRMSGTMTVSAAGPLGIGRQRASAIEFTDLLPGSTMTVDRVLSGVPALGVASTKVEVDPEPSAGSAPQLPFERTATTFAPPIGALLVLAALVFGILALRAIRRHRRPDEARWELVPDDELEHAPEHQPS